MLWCHRNHLGRIPLYLFTGDSHIFNQYESSNNRPCTVRSFHISQYVDTHTHTWNDTSRRMFITPWTPQPSMCCAVGVVIINYNTYCNYVETGSWTWMGQRASDAMTKFFLQKLLWARKLSCDFWLSNVNLKLLPPAPAIVQRHHIIFEGVANGIYSNAVHYADLCM